MSRWPVVGGDIDAWGDIILEQLRESIKNDGSLLEAAVQEALGLDGRSDHFLRGDGVLATTSSSTDFILSACERLDLIVPQSRLEIEILSDAPKGFWKGNDAIGQTTVLDYSGNSHNGTAGANVKFGGVGLANKPGTSLYTDRPTANGQVTVPSHADFNVGDTFTIEFLWGGYRDFIDIAGGGPGVFDTQSGGPYVAIASGKFRLAKNGGAAIVDSTVTITETRLLHHVMVTKTGATVKMLVDGIDVTGAVTNSTFSAQSQAVNLLNDFGRMRASYFVFYNTALSPTRCAAHYAAFQHDNAFSNLPVQIGVHTDSMYFGGSSLGYVDSHAATLKQLNSSMERFTVLFEQIETTENAVKDWSKLDEIVKKCNENSVTPVFMLSSSPTWMNTGTGRYDIPGVGADNTFKQFAGKYSTRVKDLIDRYKPGGSGPYTVQGDFWCEVWNEPNLTSFWNNLSGNTAQQWADQYAYFYKTIRSTILDRYPQAKTIMGGLSSWGAVGGSSQTGEAFLRKIVGSAQWTNTYIDYAAYHPYPNNNNPDDTTSFSNHFNDMLLVRNVLSELGYPYTPVCLTEVGISDSTSQADQNNKMVTMINRVINEWAGFVPFMIWFTLSDDISSHYGLYSSMPSDGSAATTLKTAVTSFASLSLSQQRRRYRRPQRQKLNPSTATTAQIAEALIALNLADKA
jgi:hypothetical protein